MRNISIVPAKLQNFEFYENLVPLYLRNSYGFMEHFRIWYDLLVGQPLYCSNDLNASESITVSEGSSISYTIDMLLELLNIFDLNCVYEHENSFSRNEHYLNLLNQLEGSAGGTQSQILDYIGLLFGLKRDFSVMVSGVERVLNLDNKDFLLLIKCTIIKNFFDGNYLQLTNAYLEAGLPVFLITHAPAHCIVVLIEQTNSSYSLSQNAKYMFYSGLLTVESMGIKYTYDEVNFANLAIFDEEDSDHTFDNGEFAI